MEEGGNREWEIKEGEVESGKGERDGKGGGMGRGNSHSCSCSQRTPEHRLLCSHMKDSQGRQCMVAPSAGSLGPSRLKG